MPFGRSAQSTLQQCQEPPARAERRLCFWAHSHVLSASVLGASGQFTDACSPVPKQGVFLADRRQAPQPLSLVSIGCEYTEPLDRRQLGYCGLFQKKSKPRSFSLAQPERTGMGPCRAMCCLLMCCWAALPSEGCWSLHCGWETVIKPSMSASLLGNRGTGPGI